MPRTIGLDLHKRVLEVCVLGEDGQVAARHRTPVTREALTAFAGRHLAPTDRGGGGHYQHLGGG